MMTQTQYRFLKLAEEAMEIAHRVAKLMQFGPGETEPGQPLTNAERVRLEMMDLMTCYSDLVHRGALSGIADSEFEVHETAKLAKMAKYLKFSVELGEVESDDIGARHAVALSHAQGLADRMRERGATMDDCVEQAIGVYLRKCNLSVPVPPAETADGSDPALVQQPTMSLTDRPGVAVGVTADQSDKVEIVRDEDGPAGAIRSITVSEALEDIRTHSANWREALVGAQEAAAQGGDMADSGYWEHEIRAFDRTVGVLARA